MLQNGLAEKPVFRCTYIVDVFFHAVPKKDIVSGTGKRLTVFPGEVGQVQVRHIFKATVL
jgi:hypothetical protein